MRIAILGSGAWGTALAVLAQRCGHQVSLWSHSAQSVQEMRFTRRNARLTGITLPEELEITDDISRTVDAEMVIFAAPSFALRETAHLAAPYLAKDAVLVSATKGIESGTHLRMTQVIAEETGGHFPVVTLSGPSHAEEVARLLPTGCVAACPDQASAVAVQQALFCDVFRVYTHDDVVGVELSAAFKNVTALCCGISDGFGLGDNTKALLMTRAMAELSRLVRRLGGRSETLAGLAGMGDMIVTCTSMHSRNRRFGILIGQGKSVEEAQSEVGAVVEGYYAARNALELAEALQIELPICTAVCNILYHGASVEQTVRELMNRAVGQESAKSWI